MAGDPWKGSTRDTLGLPAGPVTGGSDPDLPWVARLGGDGIPDSLSRTESTELKAVQDPDEPLRLLSPKAPTAYTGGGEKNTPKQQKNATHKCLLPVGRGEIAAGHKAGTYTATWGFHCQKLEAHEPKSSPLKQIQDKTSRRSG